MITFYDFGATSEIFGVLLARTTDQSGLPATMAWDSETYDLSGWHDNVTNNTRATVPAGVTYVRVVSGLHRSLNNPMVTTQKLNGADFRGMGNATGEQYCNAASAIVAVSANDYFEQTASAGTATADGQTFLAVEKVDSTLKRALVYKSATQALSAGVSATLSFNTEVYDTDAFHDNATNNSRMTAPATGYYRVGANMVLTGAAPNITRLTILKDGATTARGLVLVDVDISNGELNGWTAPINFTAGQYAEAQALCNSAATVSAAESTWLAMEQVPATSKICLVYKTGDQTLAADTNTALTWDAEDYDADGMHDNVTNNTRLTVPSGCTRARVQCNILGPSAAGNVFIKVTKNGADVAGGAGMASNNGLNGANPKLWTPWIDVVPGDYFEIIGNVISGGAIPANARTWASMECQ